MFPLYLVTETILPVLSWVKTADTGEAEEELCCIFFFLLKVPKSSLEGGANVPPCPMPRVCL